MRRWSFLRGAALMTAAAVAVRDADADPSLDVSCSDDSATLKVQGNSAQYFCGSNNASSGSAGIDEHFQVNVKVNTLTLDLEDSTVMWMNFFRADGMTSAPTLVLSNETLSFQDFSKMQSLRFEDVTFGSTSVKLNISSTVADIHFVNTKLADLQLVKYYPHDLTVIDLDGTNFTTIPTILYGTNYSNGVNITVNLSSVSEKTTLSTEQYGNLRENLKTLGTQTWAQEYDTSCGPSTPTSSVVLESGGMTISCGSSSGSGSASSTTGGIAASRNNSSHSSSGSAEPVNAGDSSSGVSTGALVAIIVVVIVIAAVLAFFILRMYFRRKAANANSNNIEATATLMSKGDATADKGSFISNDEFLRNFRLPQSDVALVKSLGPGRLWMGEYNNNKVVVKRVESEVTDSYVTKALMAQARTFATIAHPNITSLVGVTWLAGTDFAVVTEFMDKGNLKTVLANTDVDLDITTKLQMCCDVALALAYLHETEQNLCAKQLSSRKVLVNKAMNCKLSLFECVPSSAKLGGPSTAATYSYGMGEVAWLPPEVITRSSPMDARKNNIYAFGVLVSEIFTRVSPYQSLVEELGNTMSDVELVKRVRRQDPLAPHENRREFLEAPVSVRQLVEQCLSYAPMSRPTAKDLVEVLHNAKEELAMNGI